MASDAALSGERIEERKDFGTDDAGRYAFWMAQEKIAEKDERNWVKKSRKIVERYRDERAETGPTVDAHRFNILWSNVQTLIPTLYARAPKPDVQRRFLDQDPTGRLSSILLERCLSYSIETEFDSALKAVVQDRLLPGRGVARVLYVPHFGEEIDAAPDEENEEEGGEEDKAEGAIVDNEGDEGQNDEAEPLRNVDFEEVIARYVFWEDYREGAARQWSEVPWIRYRSYLTRDELKTRFGKAQGEKVNLDYTPQGMDEQKSPAPADVYKKAIVHEVWDKLKGEVVWYAPETPDLILDRKADPLKLPGFFPNPDPLLATVTNDKRIPVPDYIEYQDQARELDNITARIDILTKALRVVGLYPGENKQVLQQLFDSADNRLVPVEDWAAFMDKMGPNGFIFYLPIQQIAQTLIQLYNARDRVKALLYEITGLSDILRGATVPTETLGAQELKANFATRRISPQQKDVARFARDLLRLMAGVITGHFSAQTISLMTGYPQLAPVPQLPPMPMPPPQMMGAPPMGGPPMNGGGAPVGQPMNGAPPAPPPDPAMQAFEQAMGQWQQMKAKVDEITAANDQKKQQFAAAVQLLKDDGPHGFRIDIETDSTIAPDEQAEKQSRVEFLTQMIPLLENVVPLAQGNPALSELAKEITLFAARGFRVARQLEETFERAFDAIGKMPPNPKVTGQDKAPAAPQGPHPEEIAADVAVEGHKAAADVAMSAKSEDTKLAIARMTTAQKATDSAADRALQAAKIAGDQQIARQHLSLDIENSAQDHARNDVLAAHRQSADAGRLE